MQVSIFNQIYEHANIFDSLKAAQSSSGLSEWLKRQRESLVERLINCELLDDCLTESSESKNALLSRQVDLFISAIKNAENDQKSNLSFATLIIQLEPFAQKLSKQLKIGTFEQVVQIALYACQPVLGDRRFIVSQQFLELMLTQQRFTRARQSIESQLKNIPSQIVADIAKLSGNMVWKINMAQLENRLSSFLEAWLKTEAVHPLAIESHYCTLFIQHVVRDMSQPSNFWELLLLRIERQLMPFMEMISPATEALIGSIERFDFIKLLLTDYEDQIKPLAPLHEIIILRLLFDARIQSDFCQRWTLQTPFNSFIHLGISAEQLVSHVSSLSNNLIANNCCERLQVDWLKNASEYCLGMLQANAKHDSLMLAVGRELDLLSAKITEGLTDSSGGSTIAAQLKTLFLACRYAALATTDLLTARTLFRKMVVCSLSTEQYDDVWKKHREISLALAQMDVAEQNIRLNMMQIQPLMRELDSILSDIVREGIQWWPTEINIHKHTQDADGARHVDLSLLLNKIGSARMVYGQRALSDVMSWQAQWLGQDQTKPSQYSLLRKAISSLNQELENEHASHLHVQLLSQLRDRIDEIAAVKNIHLLAESIADNTAVIGASRYADLIKKKPELLPRGGNQQAWDLSIPDNLWTLHRISYIYSRGVSNPFQIFAWWWNIAIAKKPTPFATATSRYQRRCVVVCAI